VKESKNKMKRQEKQLKGSFEQVRGTGGGYFHDELVIFRKLKKVRHMKESQGKMEKSGGDWESRNT